MKLVSVGIDPDYIGFPIHIHWIRYPLSHWRMKECRLFYYVILETKPQVFFYNPTLKMKLASVGIDPNPVGFAADNVSIHDPTELLEILFY